MKTLKQWFIKFRNIVMGLLNWLKEVIMDVYEFGKGVTDSVIEHCDDDTKNTLFTLIGISIGVSIILFTGLYLYVLSERDRRNYNIEVLKETFKHEEEMNRILKGQNN